MSNYSKTTDFEAKDSLPTGDSGKIIRGAEFETEFDAISTAIATKADTAGPTFTGTLTFETISDGTIGVTAFVDEDNMASDSATLVPTQQSVKAYVDSQVTAQDLDFQADSGGALSIDLDSEALTLTGGTGIDTSGALNEVTFAIDSTVATLTGTQTLTNKTLTAPTISGNLTTDGNIDGRDVATDGAKLDGIEAGATADQTAAEIRTLVDSATDSNVFTDADHTKLDGIEASATADQTDAEIRAAVEAATDSNVFTDADHTKLDGIEASADVTDTANVTAAGALMDSEVTNLAQVKAFDSADYATAAQGSTADSALQNVVEDTTPQLGGNLDLNSNDITGTGNIDVSGSVTADGLTVDSGATTILKAGGFTANSETTLELAENRDGSNNLHFGFKLKTDGAGDNNFHLLRHNNSTSGNKAFSVGRDTGDISFYEDTGTTAKFHWDAADESLGIGTSSPAAALDISQANARGAYLRSSTTGSRLHFLDSTTAAVSTVGIGAEGNNLVLYGGGAEFMRVASSGNVGIGDQTPSQKLDVNGNVRVTGGYIEFAGDTSTPSAAASMHRPADNTLAFVTANTEAMRIDSSGNVEVGTQATGSASSKQLLSLVNPHGNTGAAAQLWLSGTNATSRGAYIEAEVQSAGNDHDLIFATSASGSTPSEAMRIDSNRNLLVGTTTTDGGYDEADGGASTVFMGASIGGAANGSAFVSRRAAPLQLNRQANDGDIAVFRKNGSTVGSIGTQSGNPYIGGTNRGIRFDSTQIIPADMTASGSNSDNSIDIGNSGVRFKDLYLSGGVYLGGTGSANKLDDYEEGTFTATLSSGATTTPTTVGTYTKIGNRVYISLELFFGSITVNGTALQITGLPFNNSGEAVDAFASCSQRVNFDGSKIQYWSLPSGTTLDLKQATSNTNSVSTVLSQASGTFTPSFGNINFHYQTA